MEVSAAALDVWRPTVAVDGKGAVTVAWGQQVDGKWDIYARKYSPAKDGNGTWGETVRVTDEPGTSFPGLGDVAFFVRLTAIAESGLEGLPATYASGRRVTAPEPSASTDGPAGAPEAPEISMTGDGRAKPATSGPHPTLR